MRVLLTGASGFIGATATEALGDRHEIVGLDRVAPKERFDDLPGYEATSYRLVDILDRAELRRTIVEAEPDAIVHLAARARVDDGVRDPVGTYRVNVEGTINVLEAAAACPDLQKCVVISSEAVYGPVETYPTPEHLGPGKPNTAYGASKGAADLLAQQFPGVNVIVARSAMGAGPRSSPAEQVTAKFIQNVLLGKPLRFPAESLFRPGLRDASFFHPTRDVSAAWNFVTGLGQILETPRAHGVYNLGSGREVSIHTLAEEVIDALGQGEILYDEAYRYREGEVGLRTFLDISRARKDFGYDPRVSLKACIRLTADWMKNNPSYWSRKRVGAHEAWRDIQNYG